MSLTTGPNLAILTNAAQGEQHYTALMKQWRWIDFHGQASVINITTATPPGSPADGDAYLVATGGTGAWSGKDGQVARYWMAGAVWEFGVPVVGWHLRDRSTGLGYNYFGGGWNADLAPVTGALIYQGTVNMSMGDPMLAAPAAGNLGWYYVVSVGSGSAVSYTNLPASVDYTAGDMIVSHGYGTYDIIGAVKEDVNPTANSVLQRTSTAGGNFAGDVKISGANLGIGTTPAWPLDVTQGANGSGGVAYGAYIHSALTAGANGNAMYGLMIAPTWSDAGHSGVQHFIQGWGAVAWMTQDGSFYTLGKIASGASAVHPLDITLAATGSSGVAHGGRLEQTLTAGANSDVLTGLYLNHTFADAGHTGVTHYLQKWLNASTLKASIDSSGNGVFVGTLGASNLSGTNTGDQTNITGNAGTATALQNARTIGGVSFDGTANITVASATGAFAVTGLLSANGGITVPTGYAVTITDAPVASTDGVNKAYVDSAIQGLDIKGDCDLGTAAALPTNIYANGSSGVGATLTGVAFGALAVDGTTVTVGMRILVKNESTGANNGIYTVTVVGAVATLYVLTRAIDADQSAEVSDGMFTFLKGGSTLASTGWTMTTSGTITIGTTAQAFSQFSGAGTYLAGTGLTLTGTTFSLNASPTFTAPLLGTPASGNLANCTFPTLNQNSTGSAASLSISGQSGLLSFTGLTSTNRIKTLRDAADTILELGGSYTPTGSWTSLTMVTPVLGTPTSGNLTNCTFPTLNQNTTGSAAKLTTARNIGGVSFDGTANITVASATGGFTVTGAALVAPAGTTGYPSINIPSGTLETTPAAGDMEYDGKSLYFTGDTTQSRTLASGVSLFRLTADGSAIGPTIADYFGANSAFATVTNGVYEISWFCYYTKTTTGTITFTILNSQNFANLSAVSANTASAVGGTNTFTIDTNTAGTAAFTAHTSINNGVHGFARVTCIAECATAGNIRLQITSSAGTVTPLRGSYYTVRRLPAANVGAFVA